MGKIICDKLTPLKFQSHNDNLDEDQISSASDSSFSSSHRAALTAGEVKTLARMQEESKLAYSIDWFYVTYAENENYIKN